MFRKISLFFISFCFFSLFSLISQAEWNLKTEFRSSFHPDLISSKIQENFQLGEQVEEFSMEDIEDFREKLRIQVSGIRGKAVYRMNPLRYEGGRNALWTSSSRYLRVTVEIDKLEAEFQTEKVFNGGRIRLYFKGVCDAIRLRIPEEQRLAIHFGVSSQGAQGRLALVVAQNEILWPSNDAWQVESIDCHGNEDFRQKVREIVQEYLIELQAKLEKQFQAHLQAGTENWSQELNGELLSPRLVFSDAGNNMKIQATPEYLDQSFDGNILANGLIHGFSAKAMQGIEHQTEHSFEEELSHSSGKTELQLPLSILSDISLASHVFSLFKTEKRSSEVPAWKELRRDRNTESYVFPDLLNFSPHAEFLLTGSSYYNPSLSNIRNNFNARGIEADFFFPFFLNIKAPKNGGFIPYVQFRGYLRGSVSIRVTEDSRLEFFIKRVQTSMRHQWNESYLRNYKPKTLIRTNLIAEKINEIIQGSDIHWKLPYWDFSLDRKLKISNFFLEDEVIKILWDLK